MISTKFTVRMEFEGAWVLKHRGDETLPVIALENGLSKKYGTIIEVEEKSLTALTVSFNSAKLLPADLQEAAEEIIHGLYPEDDALQNFKFEGVQSAVETSKSEQVKPEKKSMFGEDGSIDEDALPDLSQIEKIAGTGAEKSKPVEKAKPAEKDEGKGATNATQKILSLVDGLIAGDEFKRLAHEIATVAPEIKKSGKSELFTGQSYLFSINDGYGLTTCLENLAELISATGIVETAKSKIVEKKLPPVKESMEPFGDVLDLVRSNRSGGMRILCVDISEWMNATDNRHFKQFLRILERDGANFIIIFRIPFVDKDVLERIRFSLNDLMYVRAVSFAPLTRAEIKKFAESLIKEYGFTISKSAWALFDERITEEKSDGRFYGLNTVKKVVRELIYKKHLSNAVHGKADTVISKKDARVLCSVEVDDLSGYAMLDKLVGCENIKTKIDEIIAHIELSMQEEGVRPCIHMRFTGNPGTGKTTVARIVGKILKEKGVLRVGGFFEYAGRDFCGRYIGETAPKTASMCREAYGSVLFIDEAYSLYRGDGNDRDFGREALDTLIAEMENHRSDFVVIMAGYTDDMETMMNGNAGLVGRMPYMLEFPNFTREQLYEIYLSMLKGKIKYEEELLPAVHEYFINLPEDLVNSKEFSNARFVRNLFERTCAKAAMRCQLDKKSHIVVTKDDFERSVADKEFTFMLKKKTSIGF